MLINPCPQGGLRREWFEIMCNKLFSPSFGLFVPLEENGQVTWELLDLSRKRMFSHKKAHFKCFLLKQTFKDWSQSTLVECKQN